ncbi:hypothetical protein AB0K34_44050 [Actinomadura sp. NPDC049382]|jgi:hypothetical protein|uniref:hypothetical protein n=1 Tax=Actinomadura sp. NPDC049382 TaxID=3158220 RepID=UPI00343DAAB3
MSQWGFQAVAADPVQALIDLQAEEAETEQRLAEIKKKIKFVKRLVETQQNWMQVFGGEPAWAPTLASNPGSSQDPGPDDDHLQSAQPVGDEGIANGSEPAGETEPGSETEPGGSRQKSSKETPAGAHLPPRRVQVLNLLGQDPASWWKVRDVAEALEIENQKSLRVLLDQLARKGALVKAPDAWFRFNDGSSVPKPASNPNGNHQETVM